MHSTHYYILCCHFVSNVTEKSETFSCRHSKVKDIRFLVSTPFSLVGLPLHTSSPGGFSYRRQLNRPEPPEKKLA